MSLGLGGEPRCWLCSQCFTGPCDDALIHIMELGARQDAKLRCANILSLCKSVMLNVSVEYYSDTAEVKFHKTFFF